MNKSRWQVFKRENDEVVICRRCEATYFIDYKGIRDGKRHSLPKRCPVCKALMITDKR